MGVVRRSIEGLASLFLLVTGVFFLSRLTGDPARLYLPLNATAEDVANFKRIHGLNSSLLHQYLDFLRNLLHLDFGNSLLRSLPATQVVLEAFPTTLRLVAVTVAVTLVVGLAAGSIAALAPGSILDRAINFAAIAASSIPDFWLALVGILVFAVNLHWLPVSGTGPPQYWVLPVAVLMARLCGTFVVVVRGSMVESLTSLYIKAARGRGIPTQRVLFFHGLRNSVIPAVTFLGVQTAGLINGAVVVETIFGWPGVGNLMIQSVLGRDFAVIQAGVAIIGLAIILLNALTDALQVALDPRLRVAR